MKAECFEEVEEVQRNVTRDLETIPEEEFLGHSSGCRKTAKFVNHKGGNYVEN